MRDNDIKIDNKFHYNFNYLHYNVTINNNRIPIISQKSKRKNPKTTG